MGDTTKLDALSHLEKVHGDYFETMGKIPTEDKYTMSREEEQITLAPWEISEIVKSSLNNLPDGMEEHVDLIFDIVYEAVSEALDKSRGFTK